MSAGRKTMGRQQQPLQDGQELDVCTKTESGDDHKNWWQKSQQYLIRNGRSFGKIILMLAAVLIGVHFMLNPWDGMRYRKVCMAGAIALSTMNHPSARPIPCFEHVFLLFRIYPSYFLYMFENLRATTSCTDTERRLLIQIWSETTRTTSIKQISHFTSLLVSVSSS
jgi:hypothetical protein